MQADAVSHDSWGNEKAFEKLDGREYAEHQGRMQPVAILHQSQEQGGDEADGHPKKRHDAEKTGDHAEEEGVIEPNHQKTDGQENTITDGDEDLASKKEDEIVIDLL